MRIDHTQLKLNNLRSAYGTSIFNWGLRPQTPKPPNPQTPKQNKRSMKGENLSAELAWFHVFKAMIDDGEVAKIGASAFTTYCVIKSHTNFATGVAFPSIETISKKSGNRPTVA